MLTTCPECHTSFRVGQAQLDSRRGLVRCGRCSAVFNAYDTLLPELETPPPAEAAGPAAEAAQPPALAGSEAAPPMPEPQADVGLAEVTQAYAAGLSRPVERVAEMAHQASPGEGREPVRDDAFPAAPEETPREAVPAGAPTPEAREESPDAILLAELPLRRPSPPWTWKSVAWAVAGTLLAVLLAAQLAFFLRLEIAAWWPQTRPWLTEACRSLGCAMPLPRDLAAVRIEASALESDPENAARALLRVSLSNRSEGVVAWPHLILILTDMRDAPIAQRPIRPEEYLPAGVDPATGMGPGREEELRVELEFQGLSAYGYKLDKQYP
ncbi:MAG: zinc-ribbon domain-containing protein [Thiobacillaceae bacterium]|nr:zinc-ribbon domain-containing protein [Thiobacillaceae bacterium]